MVKRLLGNLAMMQKGAREIRAGLAVASAFTGLVVSTVCFAFLLKAVFWSANPAQRVADSLGSLNSAVAEAEKSVQNYAASGKADFLSQYKDAAARITQEADNLESLLSRSAPAADSALSILKDTRAKFESWEKQYADTAAELRRTRQTRKLSYLNRKGTGPKLSRATHSAISAFTEEIQNISRNSDRKAAITATLLALGVFLGLSLTFLGGIRLVKQIAKALVGLQSKGQALNLLIECAGRMQHISSANQAALFLGNSLEEHPGIHEAMIVMLSDDGSSRVFSSRMRASGLEAGDGVQMSGDTSACPSLSLGQRMNADGRAAQVVCTCPFDSRPARGLVCIPLTAKGKVVGVARVKSRTDGLEGNYLQHAETLSRITSIALNSLFSFNEAQQQAATDPLTGVFNRRFLDVFLKKQIQISLRQDQPLSVLMLDLDRFKEFNDRHGHGIGDALLKAFGWNLLKLVRETDLVARYGGEEFTIVLSNTGRKEALQIAERIRRAVENLALIELPDLAPPVVTVSMGLACVPEEGTDAPEILMSADDFLYQAKQAGRNRVVHSGAATDKS